MFIFLKEIQIILFILKQLLQNYILVLYCCSHNKKFTNNLIDPWDKSLVLKQNLLIFHYTQYFFMYKHACFLKTENFGKNVLTVLK